ncbi:MAG: hypothetical protein LUE21_02045 [Oscillospiraceae bacterium]|nr:hypothetical protein [Oscillospiraceae bacterium]
MSKLKKMSFPAAAAVGEAGALALTAVLLLPVAAAIHRESLGQEWTWLCAVTAAGLSICAATVFVARSRDRQALATGGTIALGYVALAALLCAMGGAGSAFGVWLARLAAGAAAGGLVGAVLSIRQNVHRKKRR